MDLPFSFVVLLCWLIEPLHSDTRWELWTFVTRTCRQAALHGARMCGVQEENGPPLIYMEYRIQTIRNRRCKVFIWSQSPPEKNSPVSWGVQLILPKLKASSSPGHVVNVFINLQILCAKYEYAVCLPLFDLILRMWFEVRSVIPTQHGYGGVIIECHGCTKYCGNPPSPPPALHSALCWWLVGFALAYGTDKWGFAGTDMFALNGRADEAPGIMEAKWMFDWAFAGKATHAHTYI